MMSILKCEDNIFFTGTHFEFLAHMSDVKNCVANTMHFWVHYAFRG